MSLPVTFLEPAWLAGLTLVGLLAVGQVLAAGRRRRYAVRFANAELARLVAPRRPGWRRHAVAGLFLGGLAALVFALARPAAEVSEPRQRAAVMLAIDVSPSMQAADVEPNRLVAAQEAAAGFIESLPEGFAVGLTAFAGTAQVVVPPTTDHALTARALDRLQFRSETAIGDAVAVSLDALGAMESADDVPELILLMSDGSSTEGMEVGDAIDAATAEDVPVSTIAFGTEAGEVVLGGEPVSVPPDPETLGQIAEATGGRFLEAETGEELAMAYAELGGTLTTVTVPRELAWLAGTVALAALALAAGLSLRWFGRML